MRETDFLTARQFRLFEFVKECHKGQFRKFTNDEVPYHTHPLAVAKKCYNSKGRNFTHSVGIEVALLHDVPEDCEDVTLDCITAKLSEIGYSEREQQRIIMFCIELKNEYTSDAYPHLSRTSRKTKEACRLSQISAFAQSIKYADMDHNLETLEYVTDPEFAKLYIQESVVKLDSMRKGDIHLMMSLSKTIVERLDDLSFLKSLDKCSDD